MTARNVTPIRAAKGAKTTAERPLPSREVIAKRLDEHQAQLYRAARMLSMLRLVTGPDHVFGEEHADEIEGISETLEVIEGIISRVANQTDTVALLAPEATAMES